jgi:hypothetical protein
MMTLAHTNRSITSMYTYNIHAWFKLESCLFPLFDRPTEIAATQKNLLTHLKNIPKMTGPSPLCLIQLLKTLTLAVTFECYVPGLWYFICVFLLTRRYAGTNRFDLLTSTLVFNLHNVNFNHAYIFNSIFYDWYFTWVFLWQILLVGTNGFYFATLTFIWLTYWKL